MHEYHNSDNLAVAIQDFYRNLTPATVNALDAIYHSDILFTDPAGSVRGLENLQNHFRQLIDGVKQCTFEFSECIVSDNKIFLCWTMTLATPKLIGGRAFEVEGASLFVCQDGRIIKHRDYCDLGAMLYEQLPLLGKIIRRLRQRLTAQ